ncbi:Uncharacterised protein [Acinetobacter baumannii]|nr:Uncharacterised protein [Acinetobacter baumannii]
MGDEDLNDLMQNGKGIAKAFKDINESISSVTEMLLAMGTIENPESVKSLFSGTMWMVNTDDVDSLMLRIKAMDSLITFRKFLKASTIPHAPLYSGILDSIDETSFEKMKDDDKESAEIDIEKSNHPVVQQINIYINETNNYITNNENVSEEEKTLWNKTRKIINAITLALCVQYGTSVTEAIIEIPIKKITEMVNHYHYPTEITDIDVNDDTTSTSK